MASASRARAIGFGLLIAAISLPMGYLVLTVMEGLIHVMWVMAPGALSGPALWALVLGVPTLAGVVVAWLRIHGNDGHNPLQGIAIFPISLREYPAIIGAIAATLVGGLVLGPEVAMVSTGATVGTLFARRGGFTPMRAATIGAGAAILALFVNPLLSGSFDVAPNYVFAGYDLLGAVGVGALTAAVLTGGRFLAIGIERLHGGNRPRTIVLAAAGLLVGALALAYVLGTGNEVNLVLTSGESNVKELISLGGVGIIGLTIAAKWLAYSVSLGSGFRGGPFFPAIYIGAGVGAIVTQLTPSTAEGAVVAGMTAAIVYLAHSNWTATIVIGAVIGMITGGWQLIPIAVVAAIVARLLPEVKEAAPTSRDGEDIVKAR